MMMVIGNGLAFGDLYLADHNKNNKRAFQRWNALFILLSLLGL
jgi:hypothetical protein